MSGKHIVLIGFMGSGKTSVGTELARLLGIARIDLDDIVVEREGCAITEIFASKGESYFREVERMVLEDVTRGDRASVICSGGGVVLDPRNVAAIKERGVAVWLRARPETVFSRIRRDGSRPVLKGGMSVEKIASILETRIPKYEAAADLTVDTDGKTVSEIAAEIASSLRRSNYRA